MIVFDLFFWLGLFIVSLAVLIRASDIFTESAEKIGLHFKIPPFIVGVTIVAIGTSLPELISSLIAIINGVPDIAVGNVVGSNIANIFLIIGVIAVISKKIKIAWEIKKVDLPFLMGSTLLLSFILIDGVVGFFESIVLLAALSVYIIYTINSQDGVSAIEIKKELKKEKELLSEKRKIKNLTYIYLVASAFFIYLGARFTIDSVIVISEMLNIATGVIAVSAVAIGTSLPELVVSIQAAKKNQPEMAIGNVIGSNIFNSLAVLGIPVFFTSGFLGAINYVFDPVIIFIMIAATIIYYFMVEDKEITNWEGYFLLIFYLFFLFYIFGII
jgi:cation:H+ antiporter